MTIRMSQDQIAIEELAECIKELARLMKMTNQANITTQTGVIEQRLEKLYFKASSAKNRVQV